MDFRRIPFQFSSTDPAKRQAELQKRFGLPVNSERDKMLLDFNDPGLMGIRPDGMSSATNSPRLQHRVPIYKEGSPEPVKCSIDNQGSPVPGRKPHVRVVPIEIEGEEMVPKRHRNLSGPTARTFPMTEPDFHNGFSWLPDDLAAAPKPHSADLKSNPRERTIPIKIDCAKKAKTMPVKKPPSPMKKEAVPKMNGCAPSKAEKPQSKSEKSPSKVEVVPPKVEEPPKPQLTGVELAKKKIEDVLEKLKGYHADVEKFSGTPKDKQYRYLDEMLTRLMLELDNVDTMGNEEVRLARKAAVRQVQASVDLLEARVTREGPKPEEPTDAEMVSSSQEAQNPEPATGENADLDADSTMAEDQSQVTNKPAENNTESQDVAASMVVETEDVQDQAVVEPEEGQDQVVAEPQIQDVEMDNEAEVKAENEMPVEVSSEALADEKETMEVDSDPVVTTSSPDEQPACCEQNVVSDVLIEEVEGESNDSEPVSSTNEPVVSLPDSPAKVPSKNIELNPVPEEPSDIELSEETDVPTDNTQCVDELSCKNDVSKEIISNSIPNEHSSDVNTDQS